MKQLKQNATLQYNHSASEAQDLLPLVRTLKNHYTFQPYQLLWSFVRSISVFLREGKADGQPRLVTVRRSEWR